jgi:hypothetical protein
MSRFHNPVGFENGFGKAGKTAFPVKSRGAFSKSDILKKPRM